MEDRSTILIVDDDFSLHEVYQVAFEGEGHRLVFLADSTNAVEAARNLNPDLLILDRRMPGLDGLEVCRRVRATRVLREIPILLITAFGDPSARLKAFEAGADDLIHKPFETVELRMRVRTICRLNHFRSLLFERLRFSWFVGRSSDGFLILDKEDEICYANPQARFLLGLPPEEASPIREGFLPLVQAQYECQPAQVWNHWTALGQGTVARTELFLERASSSDPGAALRLQVEVLDLPAGRHSTRLIRLRDVSAGSLADKMIAKCDFRADLLSLSHS